MQRLWYVKEEKHSGSLILSQGIAQDKVFRDRKKAEELEKHMKNTTNSDEYFYETRMLYEVQ